MRRALAFLLVGLVGCGSSSTETGEPAAQQPEMLPDLHVEAAPSNGFQLVLPAVHDLEPGESYEYCTWTDKVVEEDTEIKSAKGFQTALGHHVILFYTEKKQPPGTTRLCTDDDMTSFRFALGTGGEGVENEAPGNLVYHIPKGAQLVANHHYLNGTPAKKSGQSAINVRLADPGKEYVRSGSVAFVDTSLRVEPGKQSLDIECTMTRKMDLWVFSPHMHRWGSHIKVGLVAKEKPRQLFDLDWRDEFTFHPPEIRADLAEPFALDAGDKVLVHCDWSNDTGKDLTFGLEMCVAFGQTINVDNLPNIACDKGEWVDF